jgi:hypothetical protein
MHGWFQAKKPLPLPVRPLDRDARRLLFPQPGTGAGLSRSSLNRNRRFETQISIAALRAGNGSECVLLRHKEVSRRVRAMNEPEQPIGYEPRLSSVNEADLDQPDPRCFQPFSPRGDIDDHAIPFGEAREPGAFNSGDVDE